MWPKSLSARSRERKPIKMWQLLGLQTAKAGGACCFAITTTAPIQEGTIIVYFAVGLLTDCRRTLTAFSFTIGEQWPGKKTSTCKPKFAAIHSGWPVPEFHRSSLFMGRASSSGPSPRTPAIVSRALLLSMNSPTGGRGLAANGETGGKRRCAPRGDVQRIGPRPPMATTLPGTNESVAVDCGDRSANDRICTEESPGLEIRANRPAASVTMAWCPP